MENAQEHNLTAALQRSYRVNNNSFFDTWDEFLNQMEDWSVAEKFMYLRNKMDPSRAHFVCAHQTRTQSPWEVYVWKHREFGYIHITRLNTTHNCAGELINQAR